MTGVFISYRAKDERFGAAAVYEILVQRFGAGRVFRDCVSLQPGEHYPSALREAVRRSAVLLAIIGPSWSTLVDDHGIRLIDRGDDWVRREIALALSHGIPVIPVLLENTCLPLVSDLPGEISQLALVQAARVFHETFGEDVQRLAARLAMLAPGLAGPGSVVPAPASLPADVADFTGRREPTARLHTLLASTQHAHRGPVVVAGPPGVGKTALAVHVAHELAGRFEDGQLYANLRGYDPRGAPSTGAVLTWFLRALSVPTMGIPDEEDEQSSLFRSLLATRRTLILLDNVASAAQVRPLLPNSPTCRVLVTSRDSLGDLIAQDGARLLLLDILDANEAEELLVRVLDEPGRVAAEPEAIPTIARSCGYLPMAVRIAAAKLRTRPTWRLAQFSERLADERRRLTELAVGDLGVRASFALSYRGLEPRHACAFRMLGMISGPDFTTEAAAALLDAPVADVESWMDHLLDTHMVDAGTQSGYYRFHDLMRLYAVELTHEKDALDQREAAIQRLLTWYLTTAETASDLLTSGRTAGRTPAVESRARALAWMEAERPNLIAAIRQALDHGLNQIAARLAHALFGFFDVRKYWVDWETTCRLALKAAELGDDRRAHAKALSGLGRIHLDLRRLSDANLCFTQALATYQEVHDRRGEAQMINDIGLVHGAARHIDEAAECFRRALAIRQEIGDRRGEATALSNLACTHTRMPRLNEAGHPPPEQDGDQPALTDAIECYEQSLTIRREIGDQAGESESLNGLGNAHRRLRRFDEAITSYHNALSISREIGDRHTEGIVLSNIGMTFADQHQAAKATEYYHQALDIYRDIGHPSSQAVILFNLGAAHTDWQRLPAALDYYQRSLAIFRKLKNGYGETQALRRIAEVASMIRSTTSAPCGKEP